MLKFLSSVFIIFFFLSVSCKHPIPQNSSLAYNLKNRILDSLLLVNPKAALMFAEKYPSENYAELTRARALAALENNTESFSVLQTIAEEKGQVYSAETKKLALFEMGKILYYQGDFKKALDIFNKIDSNGMPNSSLCNPGWVFLFQGKTYRVLGQYQHSQKLYQKARSFALHTKDDRLLCTVLISTGKNHILTGNLELALRDYLQAFNLSENISDYLLFGDVCNHLGGYYFLNGQNKKALEYHQKSLNYRLKLGAPDEIGQSFNNIGKVFLSMQQHDSARYYFKQSIHLFSKSHYMKGMVKGWTNLGKLNMDEGHIAVAIENLSDAYRLALQTGYNLGMVESGILLGDVYRLKKNYAWAKNYYQNALGRMNLFADENLYCPIYNGLYKVAAEQHHYALALKYHEQLLKSETHRLNVENNRQLKGLLIDFETERKENENRMLRNENEVKSLTIRRNLWTLWFTLVALLFFILLSILIMNRLVVKNRLNKQLTILNNTITSQNLELETLNKELRRAIQDKDKLFSIISHELRNPLFWFKNLSAMLSEKYKTMEPEKLQKVIGSLNESAQNVYHLMDNLLFWSRAQLKRIVLKKTAFLLQDKIAEIELPFKNILETKDIQYSSFVPENLRIQADADLFSCILRNLLSNAIKYTPEGGHISFTVNEQPSQIVFCIHDSGSGLSSAHFNKLIQQQYHLSVPGVNGENGSGLGLKLCSEFVALHQGKIWLDENKGDGCSICFSIT